MASTNKTANLGLNQWVLSDPYLMEDMNADNRKIDAAVGLNPLVRLMEVTTTVATTTVCLDVSGIDLSKYLSITVYQRQAVNDSNSDYMNMRVNGITEGYGYFMSNWQSASYFYSEGNQMLIDLSAHTLYALCYLRCCRLYPKPAKLNSLEVFRGNPNMPFPVGTKFYIMGVKA